MSKIYVSLSDIQKLGEWLLTLASSQPTLRIARAMMGLLMEDVLNTRQ